MQLERALEPTRTFLISGFKDQEEFDLFKKELETNENIAETYTIAKTNFLFAIFYDISEAVSFVTNFSSDHLSIQHTISKYEIPRKMEDATEKNMQSTINFIFRGFEQSIDDNFIVNFLKQYGKIRELKISKPFQKTIEFCDIRSARKAYNALNNSAFGNGTLKCKWMWDISSSQKAEYIRLTDDLLKDLILEEENVVKRVKLENKSNKHPLITLFDDFITENICEIEKMIKFS